MPMLVGLDIGSTTTKVYVMHEDATEAYWSYKRHGARQATSVREATREMLVELGCAVGPWSDTVTDRVTRTERPRIRLPWKRTEVAR